MIIRKAKMNDKKQILEMTKATWDDGDYIKDVFDKWIDSPGEFTVLEDQGDIVGCAKLSITKPDNLWLEGIRVDPNKRRKGYAKILSDHQLKLCKDMNFHRLNLSTWYQNESVKMLENSPFKRIHQFKVLTYDLTVNGHYDIDKNLDYHSVLEYFQPKFEKLFYSCDWTFFTLDADMIQLFFDRGDIYKVGSDYLIISDLYNKENSLSLVFIHTINDELMALINHLKNTKAYDYVMTMVDQSEKVQHLIDYGFQGYDDQPLDVYLYEFDKSTLK